MKTLPQMYPRTSKSWLNFGHHPLLDPNLGIFWKILQHLFFNIQDGNVATI